jgi:hypothetical protein
MMDAGTRRAAGARLGAPSANGDGPPAALDRSSIPRSELDRRVFAGVLPSTYLAEVADREVAALGPGAYPEGDLTTPVPVPA